MSEGSPSHLAVRTASSNAEETFTKLFKMGQVGSCVNSVTHDLNNYLGAILSYSELIGMEEGLSEDARRMLDEIAHAVTKSSSMLGFLTAIARKESSNPVIMDIAPFIEHVLDLKRHEFKVARIELRVETDTNCGTLLIDPAKLTRALLYILANAKENVEENSSAWIAIEASGDAETVRIAIQNSGSAVPEDEQGVIFEPFYGTKAEGHIGLGLTQAADIADYHEGDLSYDSASGFVFTLPRKNTLGG